MVALQPERPIHTGVNVETVRIGLFENAIGALGGNPISSLKSSEGTNRERDTTALCSPKRGGTKRAHSDNPVGICLSFGKTDGEQVLDGRQGQSATSNPCGRPLITAFGQIL